MKRAVIGWISILVLGTAVLTGQQDSLSTWESAGKAYQEGAFGSAITQYRSLLPQYGKSPVLHHNLANSFYKEDKIADAILHYERSLRLRPLDQETRANLQLAHSEIDEAVVPLPGFFLQRWVRQWSWILTPIGWGILSLGLLWTGIGLIIYNTLRGKNPKRTIAAISVVILFVVCTFLGLVRLLDMRSNDQAIIMKSSLTLHVAPDLESASVHEISGGEKVKILDSLETFYKVRLVNYEEGWVPMETVERI